MSPTRRLRSWILGLATGALLALTAPAAWAHGTEALGPALRVPAAANDVLLAGAVFGPHGPGLVDLALPEGSRVVGAWLYWNILVGQQGHVAATARVRLDHNVVVGERIGGPSTVAQLRAPVQAAAYRADVGSLLLSQPGVQRLVVEGVGQDLRERGAALLVFLQSEQPGELMVRDGLDFAFGSLRPPFDTTTPVDFQFAPDGRDRSAHLGLLFGGPGGPRPSLVSVSFPGLPVQHYVDVVTGADGGGTWDLELLVPAGADSLTVQVHSVDVGTGPHAGNLVAAMAWEAATFRVVQPAASCDGVIGDRLWSDDDCNGLQDPDEPGLEGVTVRLKTPAGALLESLVTGSDGFFRFGKLCRGAYVLEVDETTLPPGYGPSPVGVGPEDQDSNGSPVLVVLATDEVRLYTLDVGYCPPSLGTEGCTPGYWKQSQHWDSYPAGFLPTDTFKAHFEDAFGSATLLDVLGMGGGGLKALGRHVVAALLNAASPNVAYPLSAGQVVQKFNAIYPGSSSDYEALKDELAGHNEMGCPLN